MTEQFFDGNIDNMRRKTSLREASDMKRGSAADHRSISSYHQC